MRTMSKRPSSTAPELPYEWMFDFRVKRTTRHPGHFLRPPAAASAAYFPRRTPGAFDGTTTGRPVPRESCAMPTTTSAGETTSATHRRDSASAADPDTGDHVSPGDTAPIDSTVAELVVLAALVAAGAPARKGARA